MSRIEPRTHLPVEASRTTETQSTNQANNVAGARRATPLSQVRNRQLKSKKELSKEVGSVSASKEVLATDISPLRGRRKDQLMGDISRIIAKIEQIEFSEGQDDVSSLCKIMLREQVRRMTLVTGTQIESDALKGSA